MSTGWAKGSTRAWRGLRLHVLVRDRWQCRVPDPAGTLTSSAGWLCGRPADTAGHIVSKAHGGTDHPENLRAECRAHNYADGARIGNALRRLVPRSWSW